MNNGLATNFATELAFHEARTAQAGWAATPLATRLNRIRRVRHLIADRADAIARRGGGALAETLVGQVLPLAEACRFLERDARRLLSPHKLRRRGRPLWLRGVESTITREPFGVVLIIAPANYPIFLPAVQLFQALAAGNAVVLKPGPGGDAAAIALRELCRDADIDERLIVVLPSSDDAAREALELPIDKIFFTGSIEVGKQVLAEAATRVLPTVAELSGCDAAIVRADADPHLAARALAFSLSFNRSATCTAARRVLVQRPCLEQLEAELVALIHPKHAKKNDARLRNALAESLAAGATALIGGLSGKDTVHLPCVLTNVQPDMSSAHLDTFAPLLSIIAVDSDDEAIAIANDSRFALSASIFSRDQVAASRLATRLHAGVVTINDMIVPTADPRVPFGGRKQSGFGVTRGGEGLLEMTQVKVIQLRRGQQRAHLHRNLTNRFSAFFIALIELIHAARFTVRLRAFARLLWQIRILR